MWSPDCRTPVRLVRWRVDSPKCTEMHHLARSSQLRAQLRLSAHVPECPKMSRAKICIGGKRAQINLKNRTQLRRQSLLSRAFEDLGQARSVSYLTPANVRKVQERGHEKFVKLGKLSHLKCPSTPLDESGMPCSAKAMRTACTEKSLSARGCVPARRTAGTGVRRRMSEAEPRAFFVARSGVSHEQD